MSPKSTSLQKSGVATAQPAENPSNISRIKKPRYRPETGYQIMPDVDPLRGPRSRVVPGKSTLLCEVLLSFNIML